MKKTTALILSLIAFGFHCAPREYHLKKLAEEGKINTKAALVNSASISINAPVNEIWNILIDVKKWPNWYPKIAVVKANGKIFLGDIFAWDIGKKNFSTVFYFDPNKKLVIYSYSLAYKSIMEWKLEKVSNLETRVSVSESRDGFFMNFISSKNHNTLLNDWLDHLKNRAEIIKM